MRAARLLVLVAACWTGPEQAGPVRTPPHSSPRGSTRPPLRVTLERTPCLGACPTYKVEILPDGEVIWTGRENVATPGPRRGRVTTRRLDAIARALHTIRFFDRERDGRVTAKPACTSNGSVTTCSFGASIVVCSDTPHAIITVTRGTRSHTVDNDHCQQNPDLDRLEALIDDAANTRAWIEP